MNKYSGMGEWQEFRLFYKGEYSIEELYNFRKEIFPILDENSIVNFLILNQPKFILLRVEVEEETRKKIEEFFKKLSRRSDTIFNRVSVKKWDPRLDAKNRILEAAKRLGIHLNEGKGWMKTGREPLNGHWMTVEDDLEMKIEEFTIFMTKGYWKIYSLLC